MLCTRLLRLQKWLYVIVGLTFLSGILGTGHHYYWIGVPEYWLWVGGVFSALEPLAFLAMAAYAYAIIRRSGLSHPNSLALHWTLGATVFSAIGAGILGVAHTWPQVNAWTHGTHITTMHGHMAFLGAYAMINLAIISFAVPVLTGRRDEETQTSLGLASFWLMVGGMFGMTMALAAAGITQTYLERILGIGYLETQQKIQVHYLMWLGAAVIFALGVARYGIEDVRQAVAEARLQGVRLFGITVDREGPAYLPRLFGPHAYTVIWDAEALPERLPAIYRKLTAGA